MALCLVIDGYWGEPHASVTAFVEVVFMLAAIYCKCIFKYFSEDRTSSASSDSFVHASVHAICGNAQPTVASVKGYCQSAASVWSPRNKDDPS